MQNTLTRCRPSSFGAVVGFLVLAGQLTLARAATNQERYYAHTEARKDSQINPPRDPAFGDARGLINSRYWDPLQRGGQR